jgi:hypothetical protein
MRFRFSEMPSLPPLAWCACISRSSEDIQVYHGPRVEVAEDWYFEV